VAGGGSVAIARAEAWAWAPAITLIGMIALRAAVVFSAQA
jgi:hypothetical protein